MYVWTCFSPIQGLCDHFSVGIFLIHDKAHSDDLSDLKLRTGASSVNPLIKFEDGRDQVKGCGSGLYHPMYFVEKREELLNLSMRQISEVDRRRP